MVTKYVRWLDRIATALGLSAQEMQALSFDFGQLYSDGFSATEMVATVRAVQRIWQ